MPRTEDLLFERWRRNGDAAALAEAFDRTAPEVWRVAVHLAHDLHEADDLVQTAFLDALREAAAWDARRPFLPWLLGILHNRARRLRRERARAQERTRDEHHAAALPPAVGSDPVAHAARAELEANLLAAIERLPEAWQQVAILHLRFGHTPAEIAFSLRRSPGTVRSQLRRALAEIRRLLPQGLRAAVLLPGPGLAAVREVVLGEGARLVAARAIPTLGTQLAGAGSLLFGLGGVAMKKLSLVLLAAACLVAGLWFLAWPGGERAGAPPHGDAPPPPLAARMLTEQQTSSAIATGERAVVATAPDAAASGALVVTVSLHDGQPAIGVGVDVLPQNGRAADLQACHAVTAAGGGARFHAVPAGTWTVQLDRGVERVVDVPAGGVATAAFTLPELLDVRGVVLGPGGQPFAGAEVWVSDSVSRAHLSQRADGAGRFALRGLPLGAWLEARAPHHAPSVRRSVVPPPPPGRERWPRCVYPDETAVLQLGAGGTQLCGLVLGADGSPSPNALVTVQWLQAANGNHSMQPPARTDAQGRFVLEGLPPGQIRLQARALDHAPEEREVQLAADAMQDLTLRLRPGVVVHGTVCDENGAPIAGASVSAGRVRHTFRARTAPDGTYRFAELPPGEWPVHVHADGFAWAQRWLRAGGTDEPLRADFTLTPLTVVRGVVVDERGAPLAGWTVETEKRTARAGARAWETHGRPVTADAEGRFELRLAADAVYRLAVRPQGLALQIACDELGDVVPAALARHELRVVVAERDLPTAFLTGRFVTAAGTPLAGASLVATDGERSDANAHARRTAADGTFRIGPLPPRTYRLEVTPGDDAAPRFRAGPWTLEPRRELDAGDVRVPAIGTLRWRLRADDGGTLPPLNIDLHGPASVPVRDTATDGTKNLVAGKWRVHVWGRDGVVAEERDVTITAGQETLLEATVRRGVRRQVRLALPDGEPRATFLVRGPRGEVIYEEELRRDGEPVAYRFPTLPLGRHAVEVTGASGKRWRGAFVLGSLEPSDAAITFPLEPLR